MMMIKNNSIYKMCSTTYSDSSSSSSEYYGDKRKIGDIKKNRLNRLNRLNR